MQKCAFHTYLRMCECDYVCMYFLVVCTLESYIHGQADPCLYVCARIELKDTYMHVYIRAHTQIFHTHTNNIYRVHRSRTQTFCTHKLTLCTYLHTHIYTVHPKFRTRKLTLHIYLQIFAYIYVHIFTEFIGWNRRFSDLKREVGFESAPTPAYEDDKQRCVYIYLCMYVYAYVKRL
jgi:hypothetical protein